MKVARMEDFPYILPYNHPPYPTPCPYLKYVIYIHLCPCVFTFKKKK